MGKKTFIDERRAHPRRRTELELQGTPERGGDVARMVSNDLSMGGLLCVSTADFPEMTRLAVRVMLPRGPGAEEPVEPLDVEAVVVRREPIRSASGQPRYELALFFTSLQSSTKEQLARFLSG